MGLFTALKKNAKLAMRSHWAGGVLILLIQIGATVLISALEQAAISVFVLNPAVKGLWLAAGHYHRGDYLGALSGVLINSRVEWMITGVSAILKMLFTLPLSLGVIRWYFRIAHGGNPSIIEIFHFFATPKAYLRAIWYDISVGFRAMFWGIVFYIVPCAVVGISVYYLSMADKLERLQKMMATAGICFSVLLFLTATLLYCAFIQRYSLMPYLICEDDDITVGRAAKTSIGYSKGFRFSMMWFSLSFLGWVLLCVFFLPVFFVLPYYMASFALYARYIIEKNRHGEQLYI